MCGMRQTHIYKMQRIITYLCRSADAIVYCQHDIIDVLQAIAHDVTRMWHAMCTLSLC
jgi:hypothetical protein